MSNVEDLSDSDNLFTLVQALGEGVTDSNWVQQICQGVYPEKASAESPTAKNDITALADSISDSDSDQNSDITYVGLVNLGSTCYLNSLIQCLYHIPYFRASIYNITQQVDGSVPSALQLLFFSMTWNHKSPASTKQLTDSFGWKGEELATQHDLHEMCIKLREKLEEKMKGTPSEGDSKRLFQGTYDNVVRTQDGTYESVTRGSFCELQLEIKGRNNILDALDDLTKAEELTDSNKYKVEEPGKEPVYKDASKFVRYKQFPPVQIFHLKRFEIDYYSDNLDQRKVYDRFEYPETLDLSKYETGYSDKDIAEENKNNPLYKPDSQPLYSIHSIIVHSGGVRAGHYYAYVRPEMNDKWYNFNDASVTNIPAERVFEYAFGGKTWVNSWGVEQVATATSYILIYVRNSCFHEIFKSPRDNIPRGIIKSYGEMIRRHQNEERIRQEAGKQVLLFIVTDADIQRYVSLRQTELYRFSLKDRSIVVEKKATISELRSLIQESYDIPGSDIRIWNWVTFSLRCRDSFSWSAPLLDPSDDGETTLDVKWGDIMPQNELFSFQVYLETAKPQLPIRPLFCSQGINIAQAGEPNQSSTYRQQKKGISHPAVNVLKGEKRLFSQTNPDDVEPQWNLTLPRQSSGKCYEISKVTVYNRLDLKFLYRFQNLNIILLKDNNVVFDYTKQTGGIPFNPRNELQSPPVFDISFEAPIEADRIEVHKDNTIFPIPPPSDGNLMYKYQSNYDNDEFGYPCTVDMGAWSRNRTLTLTSIDVWTVPSSEIVPQSPTLINFNPYLNYLIMLKQYCTELSEIKYIGSIIVNQYHMVSSLDDICKALAGYSSWDSSISIKYFDETQERVYPINCTKQTFREQSLTLGAIIVFQVEHNDPLDIDSVHFPTVQSYYEYLADQIKILFERFDKYVPPLELELCGSTRHIEITEQLGHVTGEDPTKIRLWIQNDYNEPRDLPERRSDNRTLSEMVSSTSAVIYYEVLEDVTVAESEEQLALSVSCCQLNGDIETVHTVTMSVKSTVRDLIGIINEELESELQNKIILPEEYVLLEIEDHMIKGEYHDNDIPIPDVDRHFELRPIPPLVDSPLELSPADLNNFTAQPVINVLQFIESYHPWTGKTVADIHSSPFQFRLVPLETWKSFLQRYDFCLL